MRGAKKCVIHVHTNFSPDSNRSIDDLLTAARLEKIDCLAITDHDEIRGALAAKRKSRDIEIIIGEEISTADGHLIGLFLKDWIAPGQSAIDTAKQIKAQGGLVLAPHPFSRLAEDSLNDAMHELVPYLDAIEVCNAQNPLHRDDDRAAAFARTHNIPMYAGTDGHLTGNVAPCFQMIADFTNAAEFRNALKDAKLTRGSFGFGYLFRMGIRHIWDKIASRPLPGYGTNAELAS
ncbi:MAG: PHP domain-containing protein [Phycisphaerae bacterium]